MLTGVCIGYSNKYSQHPRLIQVDLSKHTSCVPPQTTGGGALTVRATPGALMGGVGPAKKSFHCTPLYVKPLTLNKVVIGHCRRLLPSNTHTSLTSNTIGVSQRLALHGFSFQTNQIMQYTNGILRLMARIVSDVTIVVTKYTTTTTYMYNKQ